MDIFNTVASAIDLTQRLLKAIDDFQKVPDRMRRLQFDIRSLQDMMLRLREIQCRSPEQEKLITVEVVEIEKILQDLQNKINRQKQKPSSSMLSRSFRTFKTQLKFDDMDEIADELQKRKASLSLTINMLVLRSVENVDQRMQEHQEALATAAANKEVNHEITDESQAKPVKKETPHISKKDFLDLLKAPPYAEDELRVKAPAEGTALWIYEKAQYRSWEDSEKSASLHLVGKMGSGKSVLTKSIVKGLKQKQADTSQKNTAVLYYFCSCVNRTDNPSNILKGFISQLALEYGYIYERTAESNELLQSRRSTDNSGWSFEGLWHIFSRMVQCSGFSSLHLVVDALDECESKSLDDFLGLLHGLARDNLSNGTNIKLLFSSREYTHIIDALDCSEAILRLFIHPDSVSADIRIAMQIDIKNIQKRLKLEDDEVGTLQESILSKSDGMFLWVSLAAKDIMDNAYDATFETLEELIEDLPSGLKGLYEKNWLKLVESLPSAKIALANKVLVWVLLANRPLTISELTLALAIEPGQKNIPPSKKLLRNLSAFVLNYLAPFIEITTSGPEKPSCALVEDIKEPIPTFKSIDNSRVRLVHQSAQEYLLQACNTPNSRLEIDLREGHEAIARACLTYLCCDELQLGWIDETLNDEGLFITTSATRENVQARLNHYPLLGYASLNWTIHVQKCQHFAKKFEEKEEEDIFSQTIKFVEDFPKGFACAWQARQLLNDWDGDSHFSPSLPLHTFSGREMTTIVKRLLREPEKYIHTRDLELSTALHLATQTDGFREHPEERDEIIQLLLEAGVNPNEPNIIGNTPLNEAAFWPLPETVRVLLKWGVEVNTKNKHGKSPLNQYEALESKAIVETLLDAGADMESADADGFTPLLTATREGLWDTVCILINRGCDINAWDRFGWSCIYYATVNAPSKILRLLLEKGANVNIQTYTGLTPLHTAVFGDHRENFNILLEYGADVRIKAHDNRSIIHSAAEGAPFDVFKTVLGLSPSDEDLNERTANGWTALGYAAKADNVEITQLLVERGADIKTTENEGFTPFHIALDAGSTKVVQFYLQIWDKFDMSTFDGYTLLGLACIGGQQNSRPETTKLLLQRGADPNYTGHESENPPLHIVAYRGDTALVEVLLSHGADIERGNDMGLRPLSSACKNGKLETAKLLHSKGALINTRSGSTNFTALDLTVFNGHLDIVRWLIEEGADASAVSFSSTILEAKITPAHTEIFKLLMENGGDVNLNDYTSYSPFHAALKTDNLEFAKLILEYNPDLTKEDPQGHPGFHLAVYHNDKEFLELVLKNSDPSTYQFLIDRYENMTMGQIAATSGYLNSLEVLVDKCPPESFRITSPEHLWEILGHDNNTQVLDIMYSIGALDIDLSGMEILHNVEFQYTWDWLYDSFEGTVDMLNKLGMNWNVKDSVGRTVLHTVVSRMKAPRMKKLIELGARVDIRDFNCMTPFDLLIENVLGHIISMLRPKDLWIPVPPPPRPPADPNSSFSPVNFPYYSYEDDHRTPPKGIRPRPRSIPPPPPPPRNWMPPPHQQVKIDTANFFTNVKEGQDRKKDQPTPPSPPEMVSVFPSKLFLPDASASNNNAGNIQDISSSQSPSRAFTSSEIRPDAISLSPSLDKSQHGISAQADMNFPSLLPPPPISSMFLGKIVVDEDTPLSELPYTQLNQKSAYGRAPLCGYSSRSSSISVASSAPTDPFEDEPSYGKFCADVAIAALLLCPKTGKVMVDDTGASILHIAARNGVEQFIDNILEVSKEMVRDENGWTPGMVAERAGYEALAVKLTSLERDTKDRETKKPDRLSAALKGNELAISSDGQEVSLAREVDCSIESDPSAEEITSHNYSVVANSPIPFLTDIFYYEVEFLEDIEMTGGAAIGLACLPQNLHHHLPGWQVSGRFLTGQRSWGYYAYNGFRWPGRTVGYQEPYGEAWVVGDRVGCGYEREGGKVWFVRNGVFQGTAFHDVKGVLYPIVGIGGGGIKLRMHFDAEPPVERVEPPSVDVDAIDEAAS